MTGHGLQLMIENAAPVDAGFVKNEFVLAESEDQARKRAVEQVRLQLRQQADAGGVLLKCVDIDVDEVARSTKFWKLIQQEGFVFFRQDEGPSEDQLLH
jgi:hypothetical protein